MIFIRYLQIFLIALESNIFNLYSTDEYVLTTPESLIQKSYYNFIWNRRISKHLEQKQL